MLAQSIDEIYDRAVEKGRKMGLEEIRAKRRAGEFEIGREKGREEGHRDLVETARRMLLEGFDVEKTARLTGLPIEEIDSLQAR